MANPRLKDIYLKKVVPSLMEKFQYKSIMEVPKVTKISINKGIGAAVADKKLVDVGVEELGIITGQKAVATRSKNAISNFKLRENMPIGARVTLRGDNMYEFIFSGELDVWGENWDARPANGYPEPPELKYIKEVGQLSRTTIQLELIQNCDFMGVTDAM